MRSIAFGQHDLFATSARGDLAAWRLDSDEPRPLPLSEAPTAAGTYTDEDDSVRGTRNLYVHPRSSAVVVLSASRAWFFEPPSADAIPPRTLVAEGEANLIDGAWSAWGHVVFSTDDRFVLIRKSEAHTECGPRRDLVFVVPDSRPPSQVLARDEATGATDVAFSDDGRWLVAAGSNGMRRSECTRAEVWATPEDQFPTDHWVLLGHDTMVTHVEFVRPGVVVSSATDGELALWRVSSDSPATTPLFLVRRDRAREHRYRIASDAERGLLVVATSPLSQADGLRLREFAIEPSALNAMAAPLVGRNLSASEWRRYIGADDCVPAFAAFSACE